MIQMAFTRRYSAAHRFLNSQSPQCQVPHGHNWFVTITLEAAEPTPLDGDINMVAEFKAAKSAWHSWVDTHMDHTFQINAADPLIAYFRSNEPHQLRRLLLTPGDPTTEVLAALWQAKAQAFMDAAGGHLVVSKVHLEETPTNAVILSGVRAYAAHLPPEASAPQWYYRADASISDLDDLDLPRTP